MNITNISTKNIMRSIYAIGLISIVAFSVTSFFGEAAAYDLNPDVSYTITETSGYQYDVTIPEQGNRTIHYVAQITNHGPGPVTVEKAAFHHNVANWQATDEFLDQSLFQMTGKTVYQEGESGTTEFFYDTTQKNCGRVQIDAGFRDPQNGNFVFIGTLINYGVDCSTPTPTPSPTLSPIVAVPACSDVDYVAQISYPSVNNNIRIFIDDEASSPSAWDKTLSGLSGYTAAPTGFNPRLPGMPSLALHPGTRYYSFIQNNSSIDGPTVSWIVERCSTPTPTPTPTSTPTPTPTSTPVPTPIVSISVSPNDICVGDRARLSWNSYNSTRVNIDNGIGEVGLSGDRDIYPGSTTSYTATAYNAAGVTATDTAYITVRNCNPGTNYLNISKTVRNVTSGSNYDSETVNANSGDTVEFTIRLGVNSYSSGYVGNLRVSDYLPSGLRYLSGSTTLDGSYQSDGLTTGGIYLGTRYGNYNAVIKFRAVVEATYNLNTITNTATATADNVSSVNDTASVYTNNYVPNNYNLSIQKFVRNISNAETIEKTSTNGSSGNTVEFILHVRNLSSTTINNVNVFDPLPAGLSYNPNSTSLNGYIVGDGIISGGINIGSLAANQESIIRFFTTVNAGINNTVINNTAQARADNVPTVYSSAAVVNINTGVVLGALTIKTGAGSVIGYSLMGALMITLAYYIIEKKRPELLPQLFTRRA